MGALWHGFADMGAVERDGEKGEEEEVERHAASIELPRNGSAGARGAMP